MNADCLLFILGLGRNISCCNGKKNAWWN